jgi:hypothetical protein
VEVLESEEVSPKLMQQYLNHRAAIINLAKRLSNEL